MLEGAFVSGPQDHAGAQPASIASRQRGAHKHQRSPGLRPGKPNWGIGDERSLPQDLENSRNAAVMTAQTVWLSSPLVLQQPSRKKPVLGSVEQTSSRSPRTFRGELGDLHRSRCRPSALPTPGPPPLPREFRHPPWEGRWRFARSQREIALDLGVGLSTLRRWLDKRREHEIEAPPPERQEDLAAELKRLRRENEILRQEREILKRAATFFAKEGSR